MKTWCRLAFVAMAAACFFQLPVHAAELFVADAQAELWRYGAETDSRIYVGELPTTLVGLSFSEEGELFGIAISGQVWEVDPQTAETMLITPGHDNDRYQYIDLSHRPGELLLLRRDQELNRSELTRIDLVTGDEVLLGEITHGFRDEPLNARSLVHFSDDNFFLMDSKYLFLMDLGDLVANDSGGGPYPLTVAAGLAIDYETLRLWLISEVTAGEAGLALVALDPQGFEGEIDPNAPFYKFTFGQGPRAIAFKAPDDVCPQNSETLCLQDGRFRLGTTWRDFSGNEGRGHTVVDRSETAGQFWFFAPDNHELMTKVINGCAFNGHYWVFFAGTTNVEFTLTVTDFSTATENLYSNALGDTVQTRLDTTAFPCQANDVSEDGI